VETLPTPRIRFFAARETLTLLTYVYILHYSLALRDLWMRLHYQVVPYLDIPKDSATCCGSKPYNYRNPTACCGATIYDTRTHACCGDQLFEFNSQSCCNGALFDPKSFTCCSNDMLAPSGGCCTSYPELCCGGKQFDPEYQMCIDGSVSPLTCGPQATPVSVIETCCGDSVYETDNRKYCCGNHYLLETSEGVGCCNGAPYNRACTFL